MIVCLTGAQGTGKTTMFNEIRNGKLLDDRFNFSIGYVDSIAREALANGYDINREATRESQLVTTVARVNAIRTEASRHGMVMSERSPIDHLAYTKYMIDNVWGWTPSTSYYWKSSSDLVAQAVYDQITYYLYPHFPPAWDGTRDTSVKYQLEINDNILSVASDLGVQLREVPIANPYPRAQWLIGDLLESITMV